MADIPLKYFHLNTQSLEAKKIKDSRYRKIRTSDTNKKKDVELNGPVDWLLGHFDCILFQNVLNEKQHLQ